MSHISLSILVRMSFSIDLYLSMRMALLVYSISTWSYPVHGEAIGQFSFVM